MAFPASPAAAASLPATVECTIGIGQFRSAAIYYFSLAARGATVRVMRRGKLVATIHRLCTATEAPASSKGHAVLPVDVSRLRSGAGRFFDQVAAGGVIEVVHHGQRIAQISPWVELPG